MLPSGGKTFGLLDALITRLDPQARSLLHGCKADHRRRVGHGCTFLVLHSKAWMCRGSSSKEALNMVHAWA